MKLSWEKSFNVLFSQGWLFRRIIGNKYQWTQKIPSGVITTPLGIYVIFAVLLYLSHQICDKEYHLPILFKVQPLSPNQKTTHQNLKRRSCWYQQQNKMCRCLMEDLTLTYLRPRMVLSR